MKDLHVPSSIRREIGLPPGLITVQFAAPDPLDSPGGYNYEVSSEDREILEQAISDSKSPDAIRRLAAREGLLSGLRTGAGFWGNAVAFGLEKVMNLLGFGVVATLSQSGGVVVVVDVVGQAGWTDPRSTTRTAVRSTTANTSGSNSTVEFKLTSIVEKWETGGSGSSQNSWIAFTSFFGLDTFNEGATEPSGQAASNRIDFSGESASGPPPYENENSFNLSVTVPSAGFLRMWGEDWVSDDAGTTTQRGKRYYGPEIRTNGGPQDFAPEDPDLEGMEPLGALDPALSDVEPNELRDVIDALKNSPWGQDYAGLPESDPGDVRLPDPGDVPTPGPGEIPQPNPIEPGIGDGGLSPDLGTPLDNLKLDKDMGLGDLARFDMPLPDDAFGPDGLGAEPPPLPGDNFDPNDFPQGGFPNKGFPKKGFRPGDPLKIGIGPDGGFGGKIGKFEPINPGLGDFTGTAPPFADENFTKARCYKNRPITSIVRDLAVELGLNPDTTFVEPGCDKRFTGCFKKGSSKFDAMWDLADRCGYGVFPNPGDGGGTIAPVTPIRVHHGPYHEDRNLFVFDPVYDDFEVYSHVEVTRPAYRNRRGYSVVLPVNSIYSVPDDKWETRVVGPSVTEADAMDMAARRVRELRRRTLRIEVAVPYKPGMRPRHQAIVSRPTRRFRQNYMITGVRHDLSTEGWLTVWTGVYLDAEESRRYR